MNLIDKVTGNDMTRAVKAMDARAAQLPPEFVSAWADIKNDMWPYSDLTGRNLISLLDNALSLLEESAADGQSIDEVFGGDIKGFCAALVGANGSHAAATFRDRWRHQLNDTIARKLRTLDK
jgi:DNA-binding ferritin-like protein (Dps family)